MTTLRLDNRVSKVKQDRVRADSGRLLFKVYPRPLKDKDPLVLRRRLEATVDQLDPQHRSVIRDHLVLRLDSEVTRDPVDPR